MFATGRGGAAYVWGSVALAMLFSTASFGGPVVLPTHQRAKVLFQAGESRSTENLPELEPVGLPRVNLESIPSAPPATVYPTSDSSNVPTPALIPLPPGLYTGAIGLASLTLVGIAQKLRHRR